MATNVEPSNALCSVGEDSELMNCGKKAAKNTAVFGLSRATRKPSRKIRPRCADPIGSIATSASDARNALTPRYTRYPAPAYLTSVNASDDTANDAPNPIEAPRALPRFPTAKIGRASCRERV